MLVIVLYCQNLGLYEISRNALNSKYPLIYKLWNCIISRFNQSLGQIAWIIFFLISPAHYWIISGENILKLHFVWVSLSLYCADLKFYVVYPACKAQKAVTMPITYLPTIPIFKLQFRIPIFKIKILIFFIYLFIYFFFFFLFFLLFFFYIYIKESKHNTIFTSKHSGIFGYINIVLEIISFRYQYFLHH